MNSYTCRRGASTCIAFISSLLLCSHGMTDDLSGEELGPGHQILEIEKMPQWIPESAKNAIRRDLKLSLIEENLFVSRERDAIIEAYSKDHTFRFLLVPGSWSEMQLERASSEQLINEGFPVREMRSVLQLSSFAPSRILLIGEREERMRKLGRIREGRRGSMNSEPLNNRDSGNQFKK